MSSSMVAEFDLHLRPETKHSGGTFPVLDDNFFSIYDRRLRGCDQEIRLLQLCSRHVYSPSHPFECQLVRFDLSESDRYEENHFVALSYCWGDQEDEVFLFVMERAIEVSRNLYDAIHELWRLGERRIWVDRLCINQQDNNEKSEQVAMMDRIYSRAVTVYAWLGPKAADSDLAMTVLGSESPSVGLDIPEEPEVAHEAVVRLFSRPYFSRTWIIQEISLAKQVKFLCGQKKVTLETLLKELDVLGNTDPALYAQHLFRPIRGYIALEDRKNLQRQGGDMVEWLILTRKSLAGKPQDKLFALIGLATDGRKIIPDYDKDLLRVCCDVTAQMLTAGHRTDVLLLVHRTDDRDGWPSWVPNWSRIRTEPPSWVQRCLSANRRKLSTPHRVNHRLLMVGGTDVDRVAMIFSPAYLLDGTAWAQAPIRSVVVVKNLQQCMTSYYDNFETLQFVKAALLSYHTSEEPESVLAKWMRAHAAQKIGASSIYEHLKRMYDGYVERTDELQKVINKISARLARMSRWRMVVALSENNGFQWVYHDTRPGDDIFHLANCMLNVILRRQRSGTYSYIGEVYLLRRRLMVNTQKSHELIRIE